MVGTKWVIRPKDSVAYDMGNILFAVYGKVNKNKRREVLPATSGERSFQRNQGEGDNYNRSTTSIPARKRKKKEVSSLIVVALLWRKKLNRSEVTPQ